jgi:hypothetical protein
MAAREIVIETYIVPSGIDGRDQRALPIAPPSLELFLARDSVADVRKRFDVHEAPKTIPSGETVRFSSSMGVDSRRELGT